MISSRKITPFVVSAVLFGCAEPSPTPEVTTSAASGTCTGVFPSYWQDPAFPDMWTGQAISNAPPARWDGPVFRLSDAYPREPVDDGAAQGWRDARFDALFDPATPQAVKTELAEEYSWAVMRYIQEGNIDSGDVEADWAMCDNPVRPWFHMPFQTYDALSGREFVHGLTREAPVSFNVKDPAQSSSRQSSSSLTVNGTMWAVGFYNATGAHTLGQVWQADGTAVPPTENLSFAEGTVVGKLLFNTSTPEELPMLENVPAWKANISLPSFCVCKPAFGTRCTMIEQSQQCGRTTDAGSVRLLQFDIAVKDGRAGPTQWVFGTFVADGQRKASEANPWNRISPLGLMWGNDPPPAGGLAAAYPRDPRANGFAEEVIFWDVVDMLNAAAGDTLSPLRPGHLGCNGRLNGPADNANSSCMSCHMTASVPDQSRQTPPIISQFGSGITHQCIIPYAANPNRGVDASGVADSVEHGVAFAAMDGLYFANTGAGVPVNMTTGGTNVLAPAPRYASGRPDWIALDFSLQLSISLVQWAEWVEDRGRLAGTQHTFTGMLPAR